MTSTTKFPTDPEISARLERAKIELRALEQAFQVRNIDPQMLHDFRQALDHIRLSAWAVQKWIQVKAENRDAPGLLPLLTGERIRRAAQLNEELKNSFNGIEMTVHTEGLAQLFQSVEQLLQRLAPVFKKD